MIRRRFCGDARGTSAVEFALIAPAMLLLVVGIFEIAVLIFASWSLDSGAFAAARYGATGAGTDDADRVDRIRRIVEERSFGVIDADDISVAVRVFPDMAALNAADGPEDGRPGPGAADAPVLYFVDGLWRPMTPFFAAILDPIPLSARVPVMNEPF